MREQPDCATRWPTHADHRKLRRLVDLHAEAKLVPIEFYRALYVRDAQREPLQSNLRHGRHLPRSLVGQTLGGGNGGAPPDGVLITIHTIMSQAFRMAAKSNVSTAAAIRLALVVDCMSNSAADISASTYPRSGSNA